MSQFVHASASGAASADAHADADAETERDTEGVASEGVASCLHSRQFMSHARPLSALTVALVSLCSLCASADAQPGQSEPGRDNGPWTSVSEDPPGRTSAMAMPVDEYGCEPYQRHLCISNIAFGFSIEESIAATGQGARINTVLRGVHMDIMAVAIEIARIENLSYTARHEKLDMADLGMLRYRFGDRSAGAFFGVNVISWRGNTRLFWPLAGLRLGHPLSTQWITELTLPSLAVVGNQGLRDVELRSRLSVPLARRSWLQIRAKARSVYLPDDRPWRGHHEQREVMLSAGIRASPRMRGTTSVRGKESQGVWDVFPVYIGVGARVASKLISQADGTGSVVADPGGVQFLLVVQAHVGMNDSLWLW